MTLRMLFEYISSEITGDRNIPISGISYDSRLTRTGDVYFALQGQVTDGRLFAAEAVESGAVAVVAERPLDTASAVPVVLVGDPRNALALASSAFHGHPSRALKLIGITGTNGKTTVAHIMRSILEAAGQPSGMLGTIHHALGKSAQAATLTTPEAPEINRILS